ncbi:MAG TPA: hypothetical protein VEU77_07120, partial [Candidatus Acidoferrales bacterium]|nr:hypothetical protein [Candidatus Acidoferrales bacterium]
MTVNRNARTLRRPREVPGETDVARAARLFAIDAMKRIDVWAKRAETWWNAQLPRTRVGLALIAVIIAASFLNIVEMQLARGSAAQPAAQVAAVPSLNSESAPVDAGKMWSVVKMWQGAGSHDTETFTVSDHWRVDWLFNQSQSAGQLQVYIYSADGKLLNVG